MDYIVRMIAKDAPVKAMAIQGHDLVQRAREIHNTSPVATAALGRTLMATSMIGETLKGKEGSVTVRINGGGPLGSILTVSDSGGNVSCAGSRGGIPLWTKVMRKEARHTQMRDRASGVHPDILEHLPPKKKPESAECIALCSHL